MNMLKIKIADGGENYNEGLASPKTAENLSIKPKQQASFVQSQFNLMLNFKDPKDDELYTNTLRDLFYFPTFIPIMIIIIAFAFVFGNQDELTRDARRGWVMVILYMIFALGTFVLLLAFAVAQFFEYMDTSLKTPPWVGRASNYVLRKFAYGRIPDCILMLSAIAQGLNFMLVAAGNFCSSCGNLFMITSCEEGMYRNFPWQKVFFSYTVQLILPIFLKSTNRHLSFFSMIVVTGFMVVALIIGEYSYSNQLVFVVVAFHMSMFEFERYRMMSFLLGKEALNFEKTKQEKTKADAHAQLERRMNQALLQQILPAPVARQLLSGNKVAPEQFEEVTIFFSDVVGFTNICAAVSPIQVVKMLNELYTVMDYCTSHFPLYKVETIGDAYMLVGGLPVRDSHHAQQIADFALLVQTAVQAVKSPADGSPINIRIGIHSGSCMAGVVGNLMPRYCLFGDTVNTASRMESNGEPGKIHLSETVAAILMKTGKYIISERGAIQIKGKGIMTTYWLDRAHESNVNSNELAIAKLEVMVQEILQSGEQEDMLGSGGGSQGGGPEDQASAMEERGGDRLIEVDENGNPYMANGGELDPIFEATGQSNRSHDTASASEKGPVAEAGSSALSHVPYRNRSHTSPDRLGKAAPSPRNSINRAGTQHANPNALHSIRYNITHRLSGSEVFSSSGAKILVVEDSPAQRKMLVKRLHVADPTWDVSQAVSGEDALAKLQAARWMFDVVFVDENLSVEDGLFGHELVHLMRRQSQMSTSVIIACTSNPAKVTDKLLAAGVDYVWPKPPPLPSVIKPKIDSLLAARIKAFAAQAHNGSNGNSMSEE